MIYELCLQISFAVCLWIVIETLGARGPRALRYPVAVLAASSGVWIVGELVIRNAQAPDQILLGRRILFVGTSLVPVAWLWTSAAIARVRWLREKPWLIGLAVAPMVAFYSALYWQGGQNYFVDWTSPESRHGAYFPVYAAYAWTLAVLGMVHCVIAAARLRRRRNLRIIGIAAGTALPVVANATYLALGATGPDPTPLLLGAGAVVLRFSLLASGLEAITPMGRRSVFQQLDTGILIANPEGVVVDENLAARRLLGERSVVGQPLGELLKTLREEPERVIEIEEVVLPGRIRDLGFAALLSDRSEARELERRLQERQKLDSLGILAGGVAHDFNNLLMSISTHAGLIATSLSTDHPAQKHVDGLLDGVAASASLTSQLLAFSGKGPWGSELLDVSAQVHEIAGLVAPTITADVELEFALDARLPRIQASAAGIKQVAMNLLMNAAQAIERAGRISTRTRVVELTAEEIRALVPGHDARPGRHVVLEVSDTGSGMDRETLARIFEPFFTTKSSGHGLGLAATLGIVHGYGGGLAVESAEGRGSRFRVYLPIDGEGA